MTTLAKNEVRTYELGIENFKIIATSRLDSFNNF